jgi:hypothetical protein
MKKRICIIILFIVCFYKLTTAQILCINCYNTNDSISQNVNNLIVNGGFEQHSCNLSLMPYDSWCPVSQFYSCDITGWTCLDGGTSSYARMYDNSSNRSYIPEGNYVAYFGNYLCNACSAVATDTSCVSENNCIVNTPPAGYPLSGGNYGLSAGISLQQTVNNLTIGNTYVLEFWCGGEFASGNYVNPGLFAVDIGFGKTFLRNPRTQPVVGIGKTFVIQFNATSTSHTIKFTNWGHIIISCTELVLDNVRLYSIAELDSSVTPCVTGINDLQPAIESWQIKPNPFSNKINITTKTNELVEFILYDVIGRKNLQQFFTTSISINTEQLAKGIYLYEVRNKNGVIKKGKVVKD